MHKKIGDYFNYVNIIIYHIRIFNLMIILNKRILLNNNLMILF